MKLCKINQRKYYQVLVSLYNSVLCTTLYIHATSEVKILSDELLDLPRGPDATELRRLITPRFLADSEASHSHTP